MLEGSICANSSRGHKIISDKDVRSKWDVWQDSSPLGLGMLRDRQSSLSCIDPLHPWQTIFNAPGYSASVPGQVMVHLPAFADAKGKIKGKQVSETPFYQP